VSAVQKKVWYKEKRSLLEKSWVGKKKVLEDRRKRARGGGRNAFIRQLKERA